MTRCEVCGAETEYLRKRCREHEDWGQPPLCEPWFGNGHALGYEEGLAEGYAEAIRIVQRAATNTRDKKYAAKLMALAKEIDS